MRSPRLFIHTFALLLVTSGGNLAAQSADTEQGTEKGFIFSETFQGSSNSLGQVMELNTAVGHNFNKYLGVDAGMPLYFVRPSATSSTTARTSKSGLGNFYVALRLTVDNPVLNFASTLTGTAPTGDTSSGFSTGRATFDWDNRVERTLLRITPFADLGLANTVSDTHFFERPFSSLGTVGHFEAGAKYKVWRDVSVGASAYDILPSGPQKVFSKLITRSSGSSTGGGGTSGRRARGGVFETASQTTGTADITRDNGFSGWFDASPVPFLDFEVGYNRSVHYDLNTFSFSVGFNITSLLKSAKVH